MAKVRWFRIPFVSRKGTHYEVEIYKEGSNPHGEEVLLAGDTPFTTDENDDDDVFTPARTMTGTLSIVFNPSAAYPTIYDFMDAIMPVDNIDTMVKLKNTDTGDDEWLGFLNCETYDQAYISEAQSVDFSINSILETMDSVQLDPEIFSVVYTIDRIIIGIVQFLAQKAGVNYLFNKIVIPSYANGYNILRAWLDLTILFKEEEITNGVNTTYVVSGISCLEALQRLATFMGWCVRERSHTLFFCDQAEDTGYLTIDRTSGTTPSDPMNTTLWTYNYDTPIPVISTLMSGLEYVDTSHKISSRQGAKSVAVVAQLEKNEFKMGIPAFPYGEVLTSSRDMTGVDYIKLIISEEIQAYSNVSFAYYVGTWPITNTVHDGTITGASTFSQCWDSLVMRSSNNHYNNTTKRTGAFFAKAAFGNDYQEGLLCSFIPGLRSTENNPEIFTMTSALSYRFPSGSKIVLENDGTGAGGYYSGNLYNGDLCNNANYIHGEVKTDGIYAILKIGDLYWNGSGWQSSYAKFMFNFTDKKRYISIPEDMIGKVTFAILAGTYCDYSGHTSMSLFSVLQEAFFSKLELSLEVPEYDNISDRTENQYRKIMGFNFSEEIEVKTDIASDNANQLSPSIIASFDEDTLEPLSMISYDADNESNLQRPEEVLLNKLYRQYRTSRRNLVLITEPDDSDVLPLVRTTGYDGRLYLPMAESRDWQQDTDSVKYIEVDNPPAES